VCNQELAKWGVRACSSQFTAVGAKTTALVPRDRLLRILSIALWVLTLVEG
jgi:hypothetical protein